MSSNRIFSIPELTLEIVERIESRRDRLQFALTSKTFWALAVPHVWTSVDIRALYALVPVDDAGDIVLAEDNDGLSTPAAAWSSLLRYTRFIRALNCMVIPTWDARKTIVALRFLGSYRGHDVLFPKLEHLWLQLDLDSPEDATMAFPFLHHDLSPKLHSLIVAILSLRAEFWAPFIEVLHSRKALSSLTLIFSGYGLEDCHRVSTQRDVHKLVSSLPSLKEFSIPVLNLCGFFDSGPLPPVRSMSVDFSGTEARQDRSIPKDFLPTSLRHLQLRGFSSFDAVSLVRSIPSDEFEGLDIQGDLLQNVTSDTFHLFSLVAHRWPTSLRLIRLEIREMPNDFPGLGSLVQPLLVCKQLQSVSIGINSDHVEIEDSFIDAISLHWPNLRKLGLQVFANELFADFRHGAKASPRSLFLLSTRCTKLRFLILSVDFGKDLGFQNDPGRPCFALVQYTCAHGRCTNPASTARFLHTLFPNLRMVTTLDTNTEMSDVNKRMHSMSL